MEVCGKVRYIVQATRETQLDGLKEKLYSLVEDEDALRTISQNVMTLEKIDAIFSEAEIRELLNEYERGVLLTTGALEQEVLGQIRNKVNEKIKDSMALKRKQVRDAFENYKDNMKCRCQLDLSDLLSVEPPQLTIQALGPVDRHVMLPHTALTALTGSATFAASLGAGAAVSVLTGGVAGTFLYQ